ncbi:hypothetical protein KIN20_004564 [Parelaphostrongylus tenuis]|uniref:Uncharacterized protein n=1 Tax=Parelaphostrongylus tenuis TaxID=148309 RepID=A0AAD5M3B0_PARTN|nr:hypothetical protein KIN20_004564 [Parelaphostrongylus tenuis]
MSPGFYYENNTRRAYWMPRSKDPSTQQGLSYVLERLGSQFCRVDGVCLLRNKQIINADVQHKGTTLKVDSSSAREAPKTTMFPFSTFDLRCKVDWPPTGDWTERRCYIHRIALIMLHRIIIYSVSEAEVVGET